VSDVEGGVFLGDGIDPAAARDAVANDGSVVALSGGERISNDELLDAGRGRAGAGGARRRDPRRQRGRGAGQAVVEGANAPVTPAADDVLEEKGVKVLPDILANAGGVTVSYFEWVQNLQQFRWTAERVDEELVRILGDAYAAVRGLATDHGVPMRQAAFMLAIRRVAEAMRLRGI
jgi:glutamate dehydrogenase/leucine dehydrogenase